MEELGTQAAEVIRRFTLQNLTGALLALLICLILIRVLSRILEKILAHSKLNPQVQKILLRAVKAVMWFIAFLIIASEMGFDITSLIALLSVLSLGVTLALEDILGNAAGGLVLASVRPFAIGDHVVMSDTEGTVEDIRLSHTVIRTFDGQTVTIPNRGLAASKITNYTAGGRRRIVITVGASYRDDTGTVCEALLGVMNSCETVFKDPAPMAFLDEFGDSSITYKMICWVRTADYLTTKNEINAKIRKAYEENGISMDYSHMNIHMVSD